MYKDIWNRSIWKTEEDRPARIEDYSGDIDELNLSVRSFNCLKRAGCHKISDVLQILAEDEDGLRKIRNLGTRCENEIKESLAQYQALNPGRSYGQREEAPGKRRTVIVPRESVWEIDIERFHLSEKSFLNLRRKGIRKVKDLYDTEHTDEPGWFAVRELFDKIPAGR